MALVSANIFIPLYVGGGNVAGAIAVFRIEVEAYISYFPAGVISGADNMLATVSAESYSAVIDISGIFTHTDGETGDFAYYDFNYTFVSGDAVFYNSSSAGSLLSTSAGNNYTENVAFGGATASDSVFFGEVFAENVDFGSAMASDMLRLGENYIEDVAFGSAAASDSVFFGKIFAESVDFGSAVASDNSSHAVNFGQSVDFGSGYASNAVTLIDVLPIAIVMSTNGNAVTTYEAFGFKKGVIFNGKTLLINNAGLFEMSGDTDDGAAIETRLKTNKSNKIPTRDGMVNSQKRKRLLTPKIYLNAEAQGAIDLTVTVDDSSYTYTDNAARGAGLTNHPVGVGLGLDGVAWQLEVKNADVIESIETELTEIRRRAK